VFGREGQAACVEEGGSLYVGGRGKKDFDAIVAEFSAIGVEIEDY
jgi:hypothetical protein